MLSFYYFSQNIKNFMTNIYCLSMNAKRKADKHGAVYSTNPDFEFEYDDESVETLPPEQQNLKVIIDRKQRKGKTVTLVKDFVGDNDDLKLLEKLLKNKCGAGGSSKNGEILIQGDFKNKIIEVLKSNNYNVK